jgi:hypothetical protein
MVRRLLVVCLLTALVLGTSALLLSSDAMAGKGGGKGKPKPPPCDCAPTVGPCVLDECGKFDCTYICPFPG